MILTISQPSEKQKKFMLSKRKEICFGGARGGGKSWVVRQKAKLLAFAYPGIRLLIVRRSYPELMNNHINILRSELAGFAKYSDKDKVLKFVNGSTINFAYCDCDRDLDRLQGVEYDVIFLDEATQLSEYQMKTIKACVRGVNTFPKRIYYTCNPGGQGHAYIKRLFIDKVYNEGEDPDDYEFIQSLVTDNKVLMQSQPDYVRQLEALPPKLKNAWLYGRWDIFDGQFFEEFSDKPEHYADRRFTHVIEPFEIPDSWRIYRCFDWGYNHPFACEWVAISEDNVMYVILELYGCTGTPNEGVKWIPDKVFSEIHRIESEHRWLKGKHIYGVADPAIWNAETGESIADVAEKHQVYFDKGENSRIAGWMQLHYRFSFDENGLPMLYVFRNCKGFIRTIPLLMYGETNVEDVDTTGEDHIADAIRYLCMARPITPRQRKSDNAFAGTPQAMYLDVKREDVSARPVKPKMEIINDNE